MNIWGIAKNKVYPWLKKIPTFNPFAPWVTLRQLYFSYFMLLLAIIGCYYHTQDQYHSHFTLIKQVRLPKGHVIKGELGMYIIDSLVDDVNHYMYTAYTGNQMYVAVKVTPFTSLKVNDILSGLPFIVPSVEYVQHRTLNYDIMPYYHLGDLMTYFRSRETSYEKDGSSCIASLVAAYSYFQNAKLFPVHSTKNLIVAQRSQGIVCLFSRSFFYSAVRQSEGITPLETAVNPLRETLFDSISTPYNLRRSFLESILAICNLLTSRLEGVTEHSATAHSSSTSSASVFSRNFNNQRKVRHYSEYQKKRLGIPDSSMEHLLRPTSMDSPHFSSNAYWGVCPPSAIQLFDPLFDNSTIIDFQQLFFDYCETLPHRCKHIKE